MYSVVSCSVNILWSCFVILIFCRCLDALPCTVRFQMFGVTWMLCMKIFESADWKMRNCNLVQLLKYWVKMKKCCITLLFKNYKFSCAMKFLEFAYFWKILKLFKLYPLLSMFDTCYTVFFLYNCWIIARFVKCLIHPHI